MFFFFSSFLSLISWVSLSLFTDKYNFFGFSLFILSCIKFGKVFEFNIFVLIVFFVDLNKGSIGFSIVFALSIELSIDNRLIKFEWPFLIFVSCLDNLFPFK